jgi:2,3-bisphosphoglycerate-dependent phosphoglycerate mutase
MCFYIQSTFGGETMGNCIFVRHTQTDWNWEDRYSGQSDQPRLTTNGWDHARVLAEKLEERNKVGWNHRLARLVVSDLTRAQETAQPIARRLGLSPFLDSRLREVALGVLDGLEKYWVQTHVKGEQYSTRSRSFDFRKFDGESRGQVFSRYDTSIREHLACCGEDEAVIFVGHGTAMRVFLEELGQDTSKLRQGSFVEFFWKP